MAKEKQAQSSMNVHKVTLATGKVVYIREMKLKDNELAMRQVGDEPNPNIFQYKSNLELAKLLIVQVDDERIDQTYGMDLEQYFKIGEVGQVLKAIQKVSGMEEAAAPLGEIASVTFGNG